MWNLLAAYRKKVIVKHPGLAHLNGNLGIQGFEQRALARAHFADKIYKLAGIYLEAYVFEHYVLLAENFNVVVFNYRHRHKYIKGRPAAMLSALRGLLLWRPVRRAYGRAELQDHAIHTPPLCSRQCT